MLKKKYLLPTVLWILVLTLGGVTAGNIAVNVNKSGHITFGQGVAIAVSCQTQPLMITPVAQYEVQGSKDFLLSEVRVTNIDPQCMNKYLVFRFHDADGTPLAINQDFEGVCKGAVPTAHSYDCVGSKDSVIVFLDNAGAWMDNIPETFDPAALGSPFVTGTNDSYFIRNEGRGSPNSSVTYSTPACADSSAGGTNTRDSYLTAGCSITGFSLVATKIFNTPTHTWCNSVGLPYSYLGSSAAAIARCNQMSNAGHTAFGSRQVNFISVESKSA